MTTCIFHNDSHTVLKVLGACEAYANKHGHTYNAENYTVTDASGETVILFYYHGRNYYGLLCPDDFESDAIIKQTGSIALCVNNRQAAERLLTARSGVDIRQAKNNRYFLHEGLICAYVRDKDIAIQWFGVDQDNNRPADVTKHVAALLGLLKSVAC